MDLKTRTSKSVVQGRVRVIEAGRRTPSIYYVKEGSVWSTRIDTGETREIGKLPRRGSVVTINADETLIGGTYVEGEGQDYGGMRNDRLEGHSSRLAAKQGTDDGTAARGSPANGVIRDGG